MLKLIPGRTIRYTSCLALAFGLFCGSAKISAQTPDSLLIPKVLGYKDLKAVEKGEVDEISGGSRISVEADELPARTIIISKEEILRNGYSSLVDVLKYIPGFRTSQPGSAELGETFLMRGLVGNVYTKILINGVPVRPSAAPGMPLGAQLPIQQAERIEIILGPASSLYGDDAMAGVINIVLPESERPLEASASLSFGNTWRDEIHLFLGGKAGKKKDVLRYKLYATSKRMQDVTLRLDDDFLEVDSNVTTSPDYHGDGTQPFVNDMGHESRLLGIEVNWRDFTLTTQSMYRKDYSGLGSHPSEIGYDNPNNYVAEAIRNHKLSYRKKIGNFGMQSNLSYVLYILDKNSSFTAVRHPIAAGMNFMFAKSKDFLAEQMFTYNWKAFKFLLGGVYQRRSGTAWQAYINNPFDPRIIGFDSLKGINTIPTTAIGGGGSRLEPLTPLSTYTYNDIAFFGQAFWQTKKLNVLLGLRLDNPEFTRPEGSEFQLSPRLGAVWKPTKSIRLRGQFTQASRLPGSYYRFNNYKAGVISRETIIEPQAQGPPITTYNWSNGYSREIFRLAPEKMKSFEGGVSFQISSGISLHFHYFNHTLKNSIFPVLDNSKSLKDYHEFAPPPDSLVDTVSIIGFVNADSLSKLQGFQTRVEFDFDWFRAELGAQYNIGEEEIEVRPGQVIELNGYRSVPQLSLNANLHFDFPKLFYLSVFAQYHSSFVRSAVIAFDEEVNERTDGYYNVDLIIGRKVVKRLDGFIKLTNITNNLNKGIYTNSLTGYDMDYVPQQEFMFLIGLNFELN